MAIRLHPDTDLLVDYASGGLSPALCVSVSAHLHFCESCANQEEQLEVIGGSMLDSTPAVAMGAGALDGVLARLDDIDVVPETVSIGPFRKHLDDYLTPVGHLIPDSGLKWGFLTSSLSVARIPVGETRYELALHKIKAGGTAPSHDHNGLEVTVVLEGSFSDEDGAYQEGDFIVRQPGDQHTPVAMDAQCVCLSVLEAPIKLVNPMSRLLNPFFSINPQ